VADARLGAARARAARGTLWGKLRPVAWLFLFVAGGVHAHALAPSLLSIESRNDGGFAFTWKTPLQRADGGRLRPVLPDACRARSAPETGVEGLARVSRIVADCADGRLTGRTIAFEGLAESKADVIVRVAQASGPSLQQVVTADDPRFTVPEARSGPAVAADYVVLGVEHLVGGIDHVLFLIGLILLVGLNRRLVWTVTSFTLGHSVTLSLAVFGLVVVPAVIAETLIALSIVVTFAAALEQRRQTLAARRPMALAGGFGLLHGLGFAGALAEVGLPPEEVPLALAGFNVGIELGQIAVIVLLATLAAAARRRVAVLPAVPAPALYAVGTLSGFWFWERLAGGL